MGRFGEKRKRKNERIGEDGKRKEVKRIGENGIKIKIEKREKGWLRRAVF